MSRTQIIGERDERGNTYLIRASLDGESETVKALLLSGANVNAENHEGRTALMFAIVNLHRSSVQTLLDFGADVNINRGIPDGPDDGTLAPWAVIASLPFAPELVLPSIRYFDQSFPEMTSSMDSSVVSTRRFPELRAMDGFQRATTVWIRGR